MTSSESINPITRVDKRETKKRTNINAVSHQATKINKKVKNIEYSKYLEESQQKDRNNSFPISNNLECKWA